MADATRTLRVSIRGRVQGVGYRAWTERTAMRLGLEGWVRNRRDGSVEAVFHGPARDVDAMIEACRVGPRGASVAEVEMWAEETAAFSGFEVRETD